MACLWIKLQDSIHRLWRVPCLPCFQFSIVSHPPVFSIPRPLLCFMQGFLLDCNSTFFQGNSASLFWHYLQWKSSYTPSTLDAVLSTLFLGKTGSNDPSSLLSKFKLFLFLVGLQKFADICLDSSNSNGDAYHTGSYFSLGQERWGNSIIKKLNTE